MTLHSELGTAGASTDGAALDEDLRALAEAARRVAGGLQLRAAEQVRSNPRAAIGIAFAVGLVLARAIPARLIALGSSVLGQTALGVAAARLRALEEER